MNARRFKTISIVIEDTDEYPNDKISSEIEKHEIKDAIVQVIVDVHASRYREVSDKIIREKLSKAHFIAAVRKNVISESKNRLGKKLHESVPPMEALEAFLKERDIDGEKMRLLLEKGQTLMFENPPKQP